MEIKNFKLFITTILLLLFGLQSCVEPVDADYDLQAGIIFVDGYALTEPGSSTITITESTLEYENYRLENVLNAKVEIQNIQTGEIVVFSEDVSGIYQCPNNFAAEPGQEWKMLIELADGKKIESKIQKVTNVVEIDKVNTDYFEEVEFSPEFGKFIPGHKLSLDWKDPVGEKNFYLWKYITYEPLLVCKTCVRGILRDGICKTREQNWGPEYYNYLCDPTCWQIKYGGELPIYQDELEDGFEITNREIAIIPYNRREDILIQLQQYSIDETAYEYFKVINNQVSGSGGLNAPPPAALLGNLFNPDDPSDLVLGQFTAAGISTKTIFIERSGISQTPVEADPPLIIESCLTCPQTFPCEESAFRTSVKPDGWP